MSRPEFLHDIFLPMIAWTGDLQKVTQIHMFVKNNQRMSRVDFKETYKAIHDFLVSKDVSFGMLMMGDGTYVFTEQAVDMDALVIKITTGVNYTGVVEDAQKDLNLLNTYLAGKTK